MVEVELLEQLQVDQVYQEIIQVLELHQQLVEEQEEIDLLLWQVYLEDLEEEQELLQKVIQEQKH